ncbi:MAG: DUF3131 domain-containing protein [Pseudomonadota bacterium]
MSFTENLTAARHHIIFLCGLTVAFGTVAYLENVDPYKKPAGIYELETSGVIPAVEHTELTPLEQKWAQIAWRYFDRNYQTETGLVNSVDQYTATTLWDTSSYLLGMISAYRLGVIEEQDFHTRLGKALESMADLPLFEETLPNKSYNTISLAMVDYTNQESEQGIGWSALDIGRVLVPLNIVVWNYPQHVDAVKNILQAWDFEAMLRDGVLYGAEVDEEGNTNYVQEGRIGYEEYAAKSLSLMGYDVSKALAYADYLEFETINGFDIPTDTRIPEIYHAHNYVVSESYILDGLEFAWDYRSKEFAYRVYKAQEARYTKTGQLTAVSEDNIDQAPYFVYNTVFTSGKAWNAITETGEDASEFRTISTKAAIGWHLLYDTDYTQKLVEKVEGLYDEEKGWYSGWYEIKNRPNKAITANTNGIILEALAYKQFGKLVAAYDQEVVVEGFVEADVDTPITKTAAAEVD